MIVHSHPSSEKHHTHTTGQVISIAHLSTIQTLEPGGQTEMTVFRPVLYVLEYKTNTFGSPDKPGGLSIQLCKSEKKEFYIRYSS